MADVSMNKIFEVIKAQKKEAIDILKQKEALHLYARLTRKEQIDLDEERQKAYAYEIAEETIDKIVEKMETGG